jgi:hypothetical protein
MTADGNGGNSQQLSVRPSGQGWQFSAAILENYDAGVAVLSSYP